MNMKEIFKDVLPVISEYAPVIAKAIGGPLGLATGYAIPILAHAFEVEPKNVSKLITSIVTDPEAPEKLSRCEETHADWLTYLMQSVNNLETAEINVKLNWRP